MSKQKEVFDNTMGRYGRSSVGPATQKAKFRTDLFAQPDDKQQERISKIIPLPALGPNFKAEMLEIIKASKQRELEAKIEVAAKEQGISVEQWHIEQDKLWNEPASF